MECASTVEPLKTDELAKQADLEEHQLTLAGALRKYPKAVLWSILLSTSIIMEGYDIVLMGSFFRPTCLLQTLWRVYRQQRQLSDHCILAERSKQRGLCGYHYWRLR